MKQWGENMRPLKQKVSITLDGDLIDRIRSLAEEQDRSFSQYINLVLKEHLNRLEKAGQSDTWILQVKKPAPKRQTAAGAGFSRCSPQVSCAIEVSAQPSAVFTTV